MIQAKVGLNWPSGFRGEDFWKSLQTDDGCQVMAIAHTGELKRFDIFQQMKGHNNKHKKVIKHKIQHDMPFIITDLLNKFQMIYFWRN